ncbi:MAG: tetratricopeptide repeat protein [Planctomycetes bacterium]|nr:tetratricopeptide repeat protein [Planctomycetota bacterium]
MDAAAGTVPDPRWKPYAAGALLVVLVALAFAPAFRAQYIWDDDEWLLDNPDVRSSAGLERIWLRPGEGPHYYPLTFTSFWAEYHLWGYAPLGYHALNVLLHALNALLVWQVLKKLGLRAAWFGAAFFALHPVQVESVAWVTERKNVLSLFFALLSLLAYLRFRPIKDESPPAPAWPWYAAALGCFFLASVSKTVVVALPPAILVLSWWKRGRVSVREALELVPFLALGLFFALLTVKAEAPKVAAVADLISYTFFDRCAIAGRALWFYAGKLLWPFPLTAVYPRWDADVSAAPALLLYPVAVMAALGLLWFRREQFGRGALAAVLIFVGALAPVLGFFNYSTMSMSLAADHYQYHASIALLALAVAAADGVLSALGEHARKLGAVAGAALLAGLCALSFTHALDFENSQTLWTQNLEHNPDSWPAHYNLAGDAARAGKAEEASAHYREAIRIRPRDSTNYNNLACVLLGTGKVEEAAAAFVLARDLKPDNEEVRNNLGYALLRLGKLDEAQEEFGEAIRLRPSLAAAHEGLGEVLAKKGRLDEAVTRYLEALALDPRQMGTHYDLAMVLYRQKKYAEAAAHFALAGDLAPESPRAFFGLGRCLEHLGKKEEAAKCFREVLRLDPKNAEAAKHLNALEAGTPEAKSNE